MDNAIKLFDCQGNRVAFKTENGQTYLNATQMAKGFDKQPVHWLRLNQTNVFLKELSKLQNRGLEDLQIITRGGAEAGTWFHEDVAIEFAQWLSFDFRLWCNQRIKELMTKQGETSTVYLHPPKTKNRL